VSPVLVLIFGLSIGVLMLITAFQKSVNNVVAEKKESHKIYYGLWFFGLVYAFFHSLKYFKRWPLNFKDAAFSDVVPQIGILVQRFLNGEFPYQVIDNWGYNLFPTYQPMQWMPYILAELGGFDYRWIPFSALTFAFFVFHKILLNSGVRRTYKWIFSILPWVLLILFINGSKQQYAQSGESLIAAYYLLFAMAIYSSNHYFKSGTTLLCLLSRYSLVLWLPLFALNYLLKDKAKALKYIGLIIAGVIVIYVIPFLTQDPLLFLKGYEYHSRVAGVHWSNIIANQPNLLFEGIGMTSFFYSFIEGDSLYKLNMLKVIHLTLSLLSVIGLSVLYYLKRSKILKTNIFLLGSFKIYLTFFYCFIQLPFSYLFLVPLVISLFGCFKVVAQNQTTDELLT